MRLALLLLITVGLLPLGFFYPHVGLLLWGWVTVMQPHQEIWTLPSWLQINLIIAVATVGFWLVSREPKLPRASALPVLLVLLGLVMVLSQLYSLRPDYSWTYFDRHARVMVFVFLCLIMLRSRSRIQAMIWILAVSIGYYAVLGGGFTVLTGGRYLVLGPAKSMIADNNHLGLALVTIIPMLNYLRMTSRVTIVRYALAGTTMLAIFAVFGTHSRGGLIAFAVMAGAMLLKTRLKLRVSLLFGALTLVAVTFMPSTWENRMETIAGYEEDSSFQGRVDAWVIAYEVAKARPLVGAGMRVPYLQDAVDPYLSKSRDARAAHSIYFETLGSLGFTGLILFLGIIFVTWRDLRWIEARTSQAAELGWARNFAAMTQVSLVAFMVGGATVSLEFWEGFWLLIVLTNCIRGIVEKETSEVSQFSSVDTSPTANKRGKETAA